MENKHLQSTIAKKSRGFFLATSLLAFMLLGLNSCKKDDPEPVALSFATFINGAVPYTSLDFYLGSNPFTPALLYGQNSGYYIQNSVYGGFYSGTYPVQIGIGGTGVTSIGGYLAFEPYTNYSIFATTKTATTDSLDAIVLKDDLTAPSVGKAKIRFVNLGRSSTNFDLAVKDSAVVFSNQKFNSYTDFIEVTPGTHIYQLRDAGTSTARTTAASQLIEANHIYTVWAAGNTSDTTSRGITLRFMTNK